MANTNNRYALITGATSGIGYELAKLFAKDKYNLIIVARTAEDLNRTASELSGQHGIDVVTIAKDLSQSKAPFEVYDEVKAKGLTVDVLVNDAAQGQYGAFVETDINRELEIIQLNIVAYLVLTKLFLKDMVARNEGKILQVASIGGEMPGPLISVYHATKAFVVSFTEAVINEIKDTGVTMTALLPGPTATDFFNKADMENTKIVQESKLSDPAEVAKDGYDALMSGDDKVISGLKNKMQVIMSNMMTDKLSAAKIHKQMEQSDKGK